MKSDLVNLTLLSVDREHWVRTIKVVLDATELGLKESRELVDSIRDTGEPVTLLRRVSRNHAQRLGRKFAALNAKVKIGQFDSVEHAP